jgi:GR25 family glycosyltransferase involved in LPS biosynthesis
MIKCNYVINLDRRSDRWEEFKTNVNSTCLKDEKFIRFSAFDGMKYEEELKRFNVENHIVVKALKHFHIQVAKGVFGCLMSHMLVLEEIIKNNDIDDNDYVGIYEEDFCYSSNFNTKYNEFKKINLNEYDIDLIYLGGRFGPDFDCRNVGDFDKMFEKTKHPNIIYRKNVAYRNFSWDRGAFSFVIKKSKCVDLIEAIKTGFLKKENNKISFEAVDYIYTNSCKKLKMYDYLPHLFYSRVNFNSDIQGGHLVNTIQF